MALGDYASLGSMPCHSENDCNPLAGEGMKLFSSFTVATIRLVKIYGKSEEVSEGLTAIFCKLYSQLHFLNVWQIQQLSIFEQVIRTGIAMDFRANIWNIIQRTQMVHEISIFFFFVTANFYDLIFSIRSANLSIYFFELLINFSTKLFPIIWSLRACEISRLGFLQRKWIIL